MKVKCEIILPELSVQHDYRIDTYWLISVSIVSSQCAYMTAKFNKTINLVQACMCEYILNMHTALLLKNLDKRCLWLAVDIIDEMFIFVY